MLGFVFEFCILDDEPVDQSEMYQFLVWLWGEDKARFYVEEREILLTKPPPDGDYDNGRRNRTTNTHHRANH